MRFPDTGNPVSLNGICDKLTPDQWAAVQNMMKENERQKYLSQHKNKISQCTNGKNAGMWTTYLPGIGGKDRKFKVRRTRDELEDVVIEYWKGREAEQARQEEEQAHKATVADIFSEWNEIRVRRGSISAATKERNEQLFERHFVQSGFADRRIADIKQIEWKDFLADENAAHNLSSKAFSNLKCLTRGILNRAKDKELIAYSVSDMLDNLDVSRKDHKPTNSDPTKEVFNEEETRIVVKYLKENVDYQGNACLLLMFVTGLRPGEVVALKKEDLHKDHIDVCRSEKRYRVKKGEYVYPVEDSTKTEAGMRTVVVPKEAEWLLERLKFSSPGSEYVFTGKRSGDRLTTQSLRTRLRTVCKQCGIPQKSLHKIRKTYGSILLDNGVDNRLVMDQMGHTDIRTTEQFYHRTRRNTEAKQARLNSIDGFKSLAL